MKKLKLTKKDFSLLHHALDITASDYDPENGINGDGTPEPYRVRIQKQIKNLTNKLRKLEGDS